MKKILKIWIQVMVNLRPVIVLLLLIIIVSGCVRYVGKQQEVTFASSDGVELRGSLVFPEGETTKVPGVILLHGSEPATRSFAYRKHANIFLERGMAVLLYDKRGAGESGGDHDSATYAQLIDDAMAAISLLRQRQDIDTAHIGLVGTSESGWFTPELVERDGGIAFVINKVGSCLSIRETVAWEIYNDLIADGVSDVAAREQIEVRRRLWAYHISPSPDEQESLEATLGEWKGRKGSRLPAKLRQVSASYVQDISYDPAPFLERLITPMLYVYGSKDVNVPTAQCVERLTDLRSAGKPVSFHVFEGEGHELGGVGVFGYQFVDGYTELLGDFAERHVSSETTP